MERFDAGRALSLIERHRVTHGQFVPTMFVRMLKLPEVATGRVFDLSSLEPGGDRRRADLGPGQRADDRLAGAGAWTEFYAGSEGNGFCP